MNLNIILGLIAALSLNNVCVSAAEGIEDRDADLAAAIAASLQEVDHRDDMSLAITASLREGAPTRRVIPAATSAEIATIIADTNEVNGRKIQP